MSWEAKEGKKKAIISEPVQHGFDEKVIKGTDWAVHVLESDNKVIDCSGPCAEGQEPEDRCDWNHIG